MQTFQNSDFATYIADGQPIFDVWFAAVKDEQGEISVYGFQTMTDRNSRVPRFNSIGHEAEAISSHHAYCLIAGGTRAFYHRGDFPSEEVWTPLLLNNQRHAAA